MKGTFVEYIFSERRVLLEVIGHILRRGFQAPVGIWW